MKGLDYSNGEKIAAAIDKRITRIAQQIFNESPMNKSKVGRISKVKNGQYSVIIDKSTYTNVPALINVGTLSVGDIVLCLVPNNQFSNLIIIGIISSSFKKQVQESGLPLGLIVSSAVVSNDTNLHLLDGSSLSQSGIYSEFCSWLKTRISVDPQNVPTGTIEEYATEMKTFCQCGKFVINDTAETIMSGGYSVPANSIKLPTITEFIASNNGGDVIGLAELDEFKSHNHRQTTPNTYGSDTHGAYSESMFSFNYWTAGYTLTTGGDETRPKNIRYPYYIVVATGLKDEAEINAEGIINDVNEVKDVLSRTEQYKVLYDMDSNNPNINKKLTSGIDANATNSEFDFNGYNFVDFYYHRKTNVDTSQIIKVTIDLNKTVYNDIYQAFTSVESGYSILYLPNVLEILSLGVRIEASKTVFKSYATNATANQTVKDERHLIYKIIGRN